MKHNVPLPGSLSPCVRIFIESLIGEVEGASVTWLFEPEPEESVRLTFVAIDEAKPAMLPRAS